MRFCGVLMRHTAQIEYYYEFDDTHLHFATEDERLTNLLLANTDNSWNLFSVRYGDFNSSGGGVSFLVTGGVGEKDHSLYFEIGTIDPHALGEGDMLAGFFIGLFINMVRLLPEQSQAYTESSDMEATHSYA